MRRYFIIFCILCSTIVTNVISIHANGSVVVINQSHNIEIVTTDSINPMTPMTLIGDNSKVNVAVNSSDNTTYKWVLAFYIDGDNELEYSAIDRFQRLATLGSTDDVLIVALMDRHPEYSVYYGNWTDTKLFIIDQGDLPEPSYADEDWGERNMGDPDTLYDFLSYVFANFTAEHYMLVLWDHGASFFGLSYDYTSADKLTLPELRDAIKRAEEDYGKWLDIVGFDMCVMGVIEVAYTIRDLTDIVIASEHWEYAPGWYYERVFSDLISNASLTPVELASTIVNKSISESEFIVLTLSAINTTALSYAVPKINRLVGYLLRNYDSLSDVLEWAVDNTISFPELTYANYHFQKDMIHFLYNLRVNVTDPYLISLIDDAINALNASVLFENHRARYPDAYGIAGVFRGGWLDGRLFRYYPIPYAQEQQWVSFIDKLYNNTVKVWLYDMYLYANDTNDDGFVDDVWIGLDLDTELSNLNLTVKVYGYNGVNEKGYGEATFEVYGASSLDSVNITLNISETGIYMFRVDILHAENNSLIKRLYYFFDDDAVNVKVVIDDTVPPEITFVHPTNHSTIYDLNLRLSINVWDISAVEYTVVYLNGSLVGNYTTSHIRDELHLPSYGVYNVTAVSVDAFGNTATKSVWITAIDITPPVITFLSPANNSEIYSLSFSLNMSITDESPIAFTVIYLDDTTIIGNYTGNDIGFVVNLPSFGTHKITAKSIDIYGNVVSSSIWVTALDIVPPEILLISPNNDTIINETSVIVQVNVTDNVGVSHVVVFKNGYFLDNITSPINPVTFNVTFDSAGNYIITIEAYDVNGNMARIGIEINVIFQEPSTPPSQGGETGNETGGGTGEETGGGNENVSETKPFTILDDPRILGVMVISLMALGYIAYRKRKSSK